MFPRAHGVHMAPDDTIFCTDDGAHCVRKCTLDGKVLMTIGVPGKPAPFMSGQPFCRCTTTPALSPKGEIYVTDGYGNAQVHKYSLRESICSPGANVASARASSIFRTMFIATPTAGSMSRIAKITAFRCSMATAIRNAVGQRAQAQCVSYDDGGVPVVLRGRSRSLPWLQPRFPNLGPRVSILSNTGKLLARLGSEEKPARPEPWTVSCRRTGWPWTRHGDIYVGEVSVASWPSLFPGQPPAREPAQPAETGESRVAWK